MSYYLVALEPTHRHRWRWLWLLLLIPWLFISLVPQTYRWDQEEREALLAEGPAYAVALNGQEQRSLVALWPDLVYASLRTGVPVEDIVVVMLHESGGRVSAYNARGGAAGLMQLIHSTAVSMAEKLGMTYTPGMRFNARDNLLMGAEYLADQHAKFGSWRAAFAAYYGGPGSLEASGVGPGTPWSEAAVRLNWVPDPQAGNTITMTAYAEGMAASTSKILAYAARHHLWIPDDTSMRVVQWLLHPNTAPASERPKLLATPTQLLEQAAGALISAMATTSQDITGSIQTTFSWSSGHVAQLLEAAGLGAAAAEGIALVVSGLATAAAAAA
ncbi:protein of unknown function [Candidatus Hydrogenisulfobacillus filiaventi]|uniref:Transglycosylase SLT domain-containing protein n=1 Tax=Candidatus Hydrogenisulfobacillus filiaventi TaxID=2707344 RepID=A0A6F8ZIK1_9FIRM|nr:protein of unknown function [Candidatus Hydrogenisulfobacillus filiaventi]